HALAALADGRILIAGGSGPGGAALDSTDVFDPVSRTVTPGPRMLARRTRFSATRLLDGKVLLSGGADGSSDLASAEIFDPETNQFSFTAPMRTARSGHLAVVLRDNGRVLIAGGVAAGEPVAGAEFFIPWRGEFEAAGQDSSGSPSRPGALIIGLVSSSGRLMSTASYSSPTVALAKSA